MYNRATKYLSKGNYLKALSFFKKEEQSFKELYLNMGNCYRGLNEYDRAMACYERAASVNTIFIETGLYGEYPLALNNIGLLWYAKGDDAMALRYYNRALTLDPLYCDAIWNYANAMLRSSSCEFGWDKYEYRFKRESNAVRIEEYGTRWDGCTSGDKIVVLAEQGLGDKIMFSRYLSCLKAYFSEVWVQCHPSMDCFYTDYKICRNASESAASISIPVCSLAQHFGMVDGEWINKGNFNANKFSKNVLNIGVVWSGSTTHVNNHNRSCTSNYISSLSSYGDLYSLSPDATTAKNVTALKPSSWTETVNAVLGLDLVVSVDTSIVHLCGSLGVPCIMVQPLRETDFRWSGPWYKSVTIIENNDNWDNAFAKVAALLAKMKSDKFERDFLGKTLAELQSMTEEQRKEHFNV